MSSNLIKPLLDSNYQVLGINFKNRNINIFQNTSFNVRVNGSVQYNKGIWDSDLWLGGQRSLYSSPIYLDTKLSLLQYINIMYTPILDISFQIERY